ncbi:TPA: DNA-binding response regulator [Candidatus Berkelbacteria bacterium]|uniref:Two-component response regulator, YkoH n=1 Tax=Berkelbacteria bacterium GW2011_GWE1_39_12 TaxID=1618337 RepID=A0A0G4B444_9BACT|nr:MAG: two-component response regulator, YkoH [Berkelbacteria bacterium GW2011_GWE1_39_12]HBO60269.1 DNA-binding response regulator [Candidatus Berkelbacteria bacterium]
MRILIIEDDRKIANAIKKGLTQESYAVDLSFDGEDGLGSALSVDYDLIIIDRMLPEVDGIQICKALREKEKQVPILILTAKDKIKDRVEGLNAGADDYLTKPFAFDELLARVRALLRRPQNVLETKLKIADLSLDTNTFEVCRGKKKIKLSSKEFALLEYLMRNPNRILTKDNIILHVWDYDADILPNTVEVYIGYLRNKIDKPFEKLPDLISTVRGFGYKIIIPKEKNDSF